MKSSTPLIRVVTEAMLVGVYRTEAVPEFKLILFLSRRQDGSWTVGGRFPSVTEGLLSRIDMPLGTFKRAVQRLVKDEVITSQRLGNSHTYALSQRFVNSCRSMYTEGGYAIARPKVEPGPGPNLSPGQAQV